MSGEAAPVPPDLHPKVEASLHEGIRQLRETDAVGRLSGAVAHDFSNLMTVILGYTEMILLRFQHEPEVFSKLEEIRKAAERASTLTRQILAINCHEPALQDCRDLNLLLAGMKGTLEKLIGADAGLTLCLSSEPAPVRVDPVQVEQLLLSLAILARDSRPWQGRLWVASAHVTLDAAFCREEPGLRPGRHVLLSVSGAGKDRAPESLLQLAKPSFTGRGSGETTRMGTSIPRTLLKPCGGQFRAFTDQENGSIFQVFLPLEGKPEPDAGNDPGRVRRTVLCIEDDPSVRFLVETTLKDQGFDVLVAHDGPSAQALARNHPGTIDLLLSDLILPGTSGPAAVAAVRALRPGLQVLFMSGYSQEDDAARALLPPGAAFMEKPFSPGGLAGKVRALLR